MVDTKCLARWRFVILVGVGYLLVVIMVALNTLGISLPYTQPVIGFLFLTIVPGALLLRILDFSELPLIDNILFSVGASLAIVSGIGFFINIFYPIIGVNRPFTPTTFLLALGSVLGILAIFDYHNGRPNISVIEWPKPHISDAKSTEIGLIAVLPIIALFGVYLGRVYQLDLLSLYFFVLVATIPALIIFGSFGEELYPLVLWVVSISLFLHTTLASEFLTNWDSAHVYSIISTITANAHWIPSQKLPSKNSVITVVLAAPVYAGVLNIKLTWVFKLVYPFFFSLAPVALYRIFTCQGISRRVSFLSCFLFLSWFDVFTGTSRVYRQSTAIFFLGLLLLVQLRYGRREGSPVLGLLFLAGLTVSHYGTSYLFMFMLLPAVFLLPVLITVSPLHVQQRINARFFPIRLVALFVIFNIVWYIYTSTFFDGLVILMSNTIGRVLIAAATSFTAISSTSQTTQLATAGSQDIFEFLLRATVFFIIAWVGIGLTFAGLTRLWRPSERRWELVDGFYLLSLSAFVLLASTILIPYMRFGIFRIFTITLPFFTPFFFLGLIESYRISRFVLNRVIKRYRIDGVNFYPWKVRGLVMGRGVVAMFMVTFLLLNGGVPQEISGSNNLNFTLNIDDRGVNTRLIQRGDTNDAAGVYQEDVSAATWVNTYSNSNQRIYADSIQDVVLVSYGGQNQETRKTLVFDLFDERENDFIRKGSLRHLYQGDELTLREPTRHNDLVYLGYANLKHGVLKYHEPWSIPSALRKYYPTEKLRPGLTKSRKAQKIYTSGHAEFWWLA